MTLLVLGATGPIGRAICHAGAKLGATMIAVSRRGGAVTGAVAIAADRGDGAQIRDLIEAHRCAGVIDMVAMTQPGSFPLLTALRDMPARYVLISSCDVYRNYGVLTRREAGPAQSRPLDDAALLRTELYPYRGATPRPSDDPAAWMDAYDKIPIEARVREDLNDWTILRLPMVFGEGDKRRRFDWALGPMFGGRDVEAPPAWLDWVTSYGYIGNVADLCVRAALAKDCARGVFNVCDAPAVSHRVWIARLAAALVWRGAVRDDPNPDNPTVRFTAELDLTAPLAIEAGALHQALQWQAAFSIEDAIARTIADARDRF